MTSAGNINWAFGDGDDGSVDLIEVVERYGYSLREDGLWWNKKDDTDGDTVKTDQQMWEYVWDRQDSDAEDWALL